MMVHTNRLMMTVALTGILGFAPVAYAELSQLNDKAMSEVSGQGGIYVSGEVSINENGGAFTDQDNNTYFGDCDTPDKKCGARFSYKPAKEGGWAVVDDIRGKFAFEGLTLKVRSIDDGFAGDGATFNGDVLEIGLPGSVRYTNVQYTVAGSNGGRPSTDPSFQQTNFYTVEMQGEATLKGNLLVIPTGN